MIIKIYTVCTYNSGQIIATSHDLTPNGGLVREIPLFQKNLGWWNIGGGHERAAVKREERVVKYYNLAR